MKCAVEALTLPISFGVVRGASGFLDSIHVAQFLYYFCLETTALVGVDYLGDTIDKEPVTYQSFDHGVGPLISGWYCHCKLSEDISKY